MPALLQELTHNDGVIDRALAAVRGVLTDPEWWQAVLCRRARRCVARDLTSAAPSAILYGV
jgi:hypothetical protein